MEELQAEIYKTRIQKLEGELEELTGALAQAWDQLVPLLKDTPAQTTTTADISVILESIIAATEMDAAVMYSFEEDEWSILPAQMHIPGELRVLVRGLESEADAIRWGDTTRWMVVPLLVEGRVAGAVGGCFKEKPDGSQRDITAVEVRILRRLAERLAGQIIAARLARSREKEARMAHEFEIATRIQRSIQPTRLPNNPHVKLAALWKPARQVAGDAWGWVVQPDGNLACFLLDVAGKGLPAALAAMSLYAAIDMGLRGGMTSVEVVRAINTAFYDAYTETSLLATVVVVTIDTETGQMEQANAGHTPTLIRYAEGWLELDATEPPIGVLPEINPESQRVQLRPGHVVICYSDGFTEIQTSKGLWGTEGLKGAISPARTNAQAIANAISDAAQALTPPNDLQDDQTLFVVSYT